jgi:hypothetical protein
MIDYEIRPISSRDAKIYIRKYHYSHSCTNAPVRCYGLFEKSEIVENGLFFQEEFLPIGVCIFAIPCSENVRSSVFGKEYKEHVLELHRLHILDCTPKNTETWFISRCLKYIKKVWLKSGRC